ncbi:MAG: AAA family ATPase [Rhodospirillaceae bacterium]|nr:AAA family ATPase [Rhodospirillaceae bacterium]
MITEDQSETISFLSSAAAFSDGSKSIARRETHISEIFIGDTRVYKLKRAVKLPYLDFSTRQLRRKFCKAEIAINKRTAPGIYIGVKSITRENDGNLMLGGKGQVVDWVVVMNRFDEGMLFDRLAQGEKIDRFLMERLADNIATFHASAEARTDGGGRTGIALIIEGNAKSFSENAGDVLDKNKISQLIEKSLLALDDISSLLKSRRNGGCVRFCHGDMHLGNIVLLDGNPTLFDAIEFNESLNIIDVLYDLSFLLMDLEHIGRGDLANVTMNRYMDITGSSWGLVTFPLFLSVRAAIRSHVAITLASSASDISAVEPLKQSADEYLQMALDYLSPPPARLIAVGGLSGSGKSRAARSIAPHIGARPGARLIRSDVIRKRIAGVHPLDRLDESGYTPEMTEKTYKAVYEEAYAVLLSGHSVIADCVFAKPEQRAAIEAVAKDAGTTFEGLWLKADPDVMQARVTKRINNASDADASVVRQQLNYDTGEIGWNLVNSSGSREQTDSECNKILGL